MSARAGALPGTALPAQEAAAPMLAPTLAPMLARSLAPIRAATLAPVRQRSHRWLVPSLAPMPAWRLAPRLALIARKRCANACANVCARVCALGPSFYPPPRPQQATQPGRAGTGDKPQGRPAAGHGGGGGADAAPADVGGPRGCWDGWGTGTHGGGLGARMVLGRLGDRDPFLGGSTPSFTQAPRRPSPAAPPTTPRPLLGRGDAWHRYRPFL